MDATELDQPHDATPHGRPHASLQIGPDFWRLYVSGVTRVGGDAFFQVTLLGPRTVQLTVSAPAAVVPGVTGRQLLDAVCDWLLSGDTRDQVYLDVRGNARGGRLERDQPRRLR
jgi:hypothetical protein